MSTRFSPPPQRKVVHELTEALIRKRKACEKVHQSYIFNRTNDRNIIETSILAKKYPDMVRDSLLTIARVKLVPSVFELDESGTVDSKFEVKEALVWSVARQVMDPKNPQTVALAHCTIKEGVYQRPFAEIDRDDNGTVIKSEIKFWKNMFWVPYSKKKAMEIINEYGGTYRNTVCAQAIERGDHWHTGKTWNIPNLQEFIEVPFETLVQANKMGVLSFDWGGHVRYLKKVEEDRSRLQSDIEEFTSKKPTKK